MRVEVFNTIIFTKMYDADVDTAVSVATKNSQTIQNILDEKFIEILKSVNLPIKEIEWKNKDIFEWRNTYYYIYKDKDGYSIENTELGYWKESAEVKPILINLEEND